MLGTTTFNLAAKSIQLAGGGAVTNSGTWGVPTAGTFTCLGSATFAGNDINFYNFSCEAPSAVLTFAATKTYQVDGTLTLNGQATGTKINLLSDSAGSAFIIQNDGGSESVKYVTVKDCEATTNPIHAISSSAVSNVTNWIFATISEIAGGLWNSGTTWVGGVVPTSTDNVTIAGNVNLDVSPTVTDLTVNTGKELACTTYSISVNGDSDIDGTVTISTGTYDANGNFDATGGTITFTDAGFLLLGGETITSLGTLSTANGTVNYDRVGSQTVFADTYNNLIISGGAGTKTLGGAIVVNGGLSIAADTTLDVSTANYAISVAGDWSNSGIFTAQAGTVTFTGSAAQALAPGGSSFYDVTLNKTNKTDTVTPSADLVVGHVRC